MISVVINVVLSIGFFVGLFGTRGPFALGAVGPDFFPQSFMVALMGTLVPSLIANRRLGGGIRPIVLRCLGIAILSAAIAGGLGWRWFATHPATLLPLASMLPLKAVFGGILAAIVTPIALRLLFNSAQQAKP
ncbi:hypothetical protein Q4F19_13110 [Sphingomonas sp. BIUV-7]|uniref:Uncharacterized protein n=1 Tax=Sphingomonas natans TaxID=3063330 RepID=A0ABT8YAH4_9SPHN|nr:hypothetical protein [Sphingomonas sp. BIUV-7]MDO6415326.1 hypothetical protein [Sphingomonas sp. BIUV-7]